jgi:hypothetical protein
MGMETKPYQLKTFGLHGSWHYCDQASLFPALVELGFRANRFKDGQPVVDANVMSGVPAKAVAAGLVSWPDA